MIHRHSNIFENPCNCRDSRQGTCNYEKNLISVNMRQGRSLLLGVHPDDELALVPTGCQGPEGQLHLVQAVDPLPDLETRLREVCGCKQRLYRINLPIRDEFSEIIQHRSLQPGVPPVLQTGESGMLRY